LAVALAPAMASTPRAAALRLAPRRAASTVAMANHNRLWLAAVDSRFIAMSQGLGGSAETAREIARSTSFTSSARRVNHASTARQYGPRPRHARTACA
jgi:hypothetical protein